MMQKAHWQLGLFLASALYSQTFFAGDYSIFYASDFYPNKEQASLIFTSEFAIQTNLFKNNAMVMLIQGEFNKSAAQQIHDNIFDHIKKQYLATGSLNQAITNAFMVLDKKICQTMEPYSGSQVTLLFFKGDTIVVAHAGNAHAVLGMGDTHHILTKNHMLSDANECKRVIKAGGITGDNRIFIPFNCAPVVAPDIDSKSYLSVTTTRGIGYRAFKQFNPEALKNLVAPKTPPKDEHIITATPSIFEHAVLGTESFIIIGSNQFWDLVSPEDAVSFVQFHLQDENLSTENHIKKCMEILSKGLINFALGKIMSNDFKDKSFGVMLIFFDWKNT